MQIARTIDDARSAVASARAQGKTIGFVPTMGYLHAGHLSLIDLARKHGTHFVVVSIFVNPLQFSQGEDLDRYPRDEERDRQLLEGRSVDLLFAPTHSVIYPDGAATRVRVPGVSEPLEGERRPGHFEGVATVVGKLFNIVRPDLATFGQKDAQQCAVIAAMVKDLDIPVRLYFGETIRESDGLAMSSRNAYLSSAERTIATTLYKALSAGADVLKHGGSAMEIRQLMHTFASATAGVEVDYLELVDPTTFRTPKHLDQDLLLVGAIRVGKTRLIDNLRVRKQIDPDTTLTFRR